MRPVDEVRNGHSAEWRLDVHSAPLENAVVLARLARLAYLDAFDCPTEGPIEARAEVSAFCGAFPEVRPIHTPRIRGFVAASGTDTVVAFAGTHRADHWSESLRYEQVMDFGGRAHRGFADVLAEIVDPMLAGLYDADALAKTLWLTGHSLGGGVAVLAGWRLHNLGYEPEAVCTFGAPPVLDAAAAEDYPVAVWRVTNDGDWVPRMQWPRLGSRYTHPGRHFHLLRSGRLAPEHQSPELARKLDRFQRIEEPFDHGGPFVDHNMKEYIRRLEATVHQQ